MVSVRGIFALERQGSANPDVQKPTALPRIASGRATRAKKKKDVEPVHTRPVLVGLRVFWETLFPVQQGEVHAVHR